MLASYPTCNLVAEQQFVAIAPSQPSGPLKPTAMGPDSSEPAVSPETANRRMSNDMWGCGVMWVSPQIQGESKLIF